MQLMTRSRARELGLTTYFTGNPCKRGHVDYRNTSSSNCLACWREDAKRKRDIDPSAFKQRKAGEYQRNKSDILAKQKEYRKQNWAEIYAKRKASEDYAQYMREYLSSYYKRDIPRAKQLARTRRRPEIVARAVPCWTTDEDIKAIQQMYIDAALLSKTTGIPHAVDHIIPLRGALVCGLHHPSNLQILTQRDNSVKSNSFTVS